VGKLLCRRYIIQGLDEKHEDATFSGVLGLLSWGWIAVVSGLGREGVGHWEGQEDILWVPPPMDLIIAELVGQA
jgi:hypothetical protein